MVKNSLFVSAIVMLALGFLLLEECRFLAPYRDVLWKSYRTPIFVFSGILYVNLFAAVYGVSRRLAFKDTGRKLAHVEKQLRSAETVSEELSHRIEELGG